MAGKNSCVFRSLGCGITLLFLGGVGYGLWYWLGKPDLAQIASDVIDQFGDMTDVLTNFTDFTDGFEFDPFEGSVASNETDMWRNEPNVGQGGLYLTIENALDDNWTQEFNLAIQDWEDGTPDALELQTTRVEVDHMCEQKSGVMKVCNGNYGDTGWLGINEIMLNGYITSSVAKMNEYYLHNAAFDKRQYTMCHEVGHGFGLPHTDENFYNLDLGNCMDYTNIPSNNLHPAEMNYERLASVYGTIGQNAAVESAAEKNADDRRRRWLRQKEQHGKTRRFPSDTEYKAAMDELQHQLNVRRRTTRTSSHQHHRGHTTQWRMLTSERHRTLKGGQTFSRRLSNGIELRVHVLFAF